MSVPGLNFSKDFHSDCGVCRFWTRVDGPEGSNGGMCFRNAPLPVVYELRPDERPWTVWPLTHATDVCGEFAVMEPII